MATSESFSTPLANSYSSTRFDLSHVSASLTFKSQLSNLPESRHFADWDGEEGIGACFAQHNNANKGSLQGLAGSVPNAYRLLVT